MSSSSGEGMSYAAVAGHNADQSLEEARAPPVDTVIPNESPSTSTLIDVDSGVSVVPPDFREQTIKTETQATRLELEGEAATTPAANEKQGQQDVLNSVVGGVAAVILGIGAIKKYRIGELSWRVVGIWGGVITAATAVDILLSRQYLRKA